MPLSVKVCTYTANRQLVSPEFIGSHICIPMAFTAESPLVNAIGTQLRDPIYSGLTRWHMAVINE